MDASKNPERKAFRLYGRAKAKPLTARQQKLMDELYPQIEVDTDNPLTCLEGFKTKRLEIGFGGGEHLAHRAAENPEIGYIGAEPFVNGVAKLLSEIDARELTNVRLYRGDVRLVTPNIADGALDQVDILYPDPWPKSRHNKRRLVSYEFAHELARMIRPGGILRFASDIPDYVDWAMIRIMASEKFDWPASEAAHWRKPYAGWPGTRYEDKAKTAGRIPAYLHFVRKDHVTKA